MEQDIIFDLIAEESKRQKSQINLIASENISSPAVHRAVGSDLMHKYSEGNISKRYYEGNQFIDEIEQTAISRARKLFQLPTNWDVNIQALSGSNANLAVLLATLKPGDTILSMYLYDGGHLSHGWSYDKEAQENTANPLVHEPGERKVHIVSKLFNVIQYKTNPDNQLLDYAEIAQIAQKYQPKMLITGGTAYPRNIDYQRMSKIAEQVGALYLADIAHEAGLVAANVVPSPVGIADIVTMTTHKTLRAARGSLILAREDIIKKVNRAVLPGLQGGPFNNNIAGIAVGLQEALQPEFTQYARQILNNASTLASELKSKGYEIISGGTDKHLVLVNTLKSNGLTGAQAAKALATANIICNMNTVPWDKRSPRDPSGIRLGTPMLTTQGATETEIQELASLIDRALTAAAEIKAAEDFYALLAELPELKQVAAAANTFMAKLHG